MGEPLLFGLAGPEEASSYLAERGLAMVSDLGPDELAQRYLPSPDLRVFGSMRIVHARRD